MDEERLFQCECTCCGHIWKTSGLESEGPAENVCENCGEICQHYFDLGPSLPKEINNDR